MADMNTDFMAQFNNLGQSQQMVFMLAGSVLGLLILVLVAVVFINRSSRIAMKVDIKNRKSGLIKNLPYQARIYVKKEGGGVWVNDKWGICKFEGKTIGCLKFAGYTFEAPKYDDVFPGNLLIAISPNFGELYPLRMDENTKHLQAQIDYDMVGHVYNQQRANINTFSKQAAWEKILPYAIVVTVLMGCLAMVFIVTKLQLDQMAVLSSSMQEAAKQLAAASSACKPAPPV